MTNPTILALLICLTGMSSPSRLWALERERLQFYTRIGSHQVDADTVSLAKPSDVNVLMQDTHPLDIGAGMNYKKGGIHLQLGPRYDLTTHGGLPVEKVIVEGHIGVRW